MERLKSLDAEFLHLENGVAHMHIAGACVFGGTPPTATELVDLIAGKMHEIPQYRQRIRPVPFELGRPVWADDPHFDLEYHVRHTALPAPGDDATFARLMGRLMSRPLDRERAAVGGVAGRGPRGRPVGAGVQGPPLHGRRHRGRRSCSPCCSTSTPDAVPAPPRPWSPAARAGGRGEGARRLGRARRRTRRPRPDNSRARAIHPDRAVDVARSRRSAAWASSSATSARRRSVRPSWSSARTGPGRTPPCRSARRRRPEGLRGHRERRGARRDGRELPRAAAQPGLDPATTIVRSAVPVSTRGGDVHGVPTTGCR